MYLNNAEKHYLALIFEKFILPHFSVADYIIFFEWDSVTQSYRYVVVPKGNKNKFLSFYLRKHDRIDDYEMIVVYTGIGEFDYHNNQKLLFLLAHDDLKRFNRMYKDFIGRLKEMSFEESPVDFYVHFPFIKHLK